MVPRGNQTRRLGIFFAIGRKVVDAFKHRAGKAKTEKVILL